MKYLSVCSGIEAATVAWHPLGWTPFAFAQFDPDHNYKRGPDFPSAVLAHHYGSNLPGEALTTNGVPNFGDMSNFKEWPDATIDLLVGGTPCQSFSVAGLRKGLADPRGNLCLTYLAIADRYRPEWVVWENVPGVLSSGKGRDFGAFVGGLEQLGYHASWRVLDAQYIRVDGFGRAVPQRRRRVFVVGHLGDWRRPAAVLFEPESLSGNPAPRRQAGQSVAPTISSRPTGGGGLGTDFDCDGGLVAKALNAKGGSGRSDGESETFVAHPLLAKSNSSHDDSMETYIAHALRADGFDASEDGTGRGTPTVPIAFQTRGSNLDVGEISGTMGVNGGSASGSAPCVAFDLRGREGGSQFEGPHDTANIRSASGGSSRSYVAQGVADTLLSSYSKTAAKAGKEVGLVNPIIQNWAVRRLMPIECERLQGFPDCYTDVPWRRRNATPDGPRYKALGNSMAVNAMRWLGRRIELVNGLLK